MNLEKYQNNLESARDVGQQMYRFAQELFPICRSITGNGVRQTLKLIQSYLPEMQIFEVPSGETCLDWTVPFEWNIKDAYVKNSTGRRVIDFKANNLHLVNYSEPVSKKISLEELQKNLHSLPDQPDAIPYITSYYNRTWGFCLTHNDRLRLKPDQYEVFIDSSLEKGSLTYGEVFLPGESEKEIFLSTYICHPSMGNNEVSGPVLTAFLGQWIKQKKRRYSYRLVFVPETIGAIVYIDKNLESLRKKVFGAYQITCVGDDRDYSFLPSRLGGTVTDKITTHVMNRLVPGYKNYSFADRGSDERQYCSPGVDLPMVSVMRSKYATYPEYHTSLDNLDLISASGFEGSFNVYTRCLELFEENRKFQVTCIGEPQLGKRGLRPTLGTKDMAARVRNMANVLAFSDGNHDLVDIAELLGVDALDLAPLAQKLREADLLRLADE